MHTSPSPRQIGPETRKDTILKSDRSDRNNVLEKIIPVAENEMSTRMQMERERSSYPKIPIHLTSDGACWFGGTQKENKSLFSFARDREPTAGRDLKGKD